MQKKNTETVRNGDLGTISAIAGGDAPAITVMFDAGEVEDYDDSSVDQLELAYAMSIHKSQGTECKVILMILGSEKLFPAPELGVYRDHQSERILRFVWSVGNAAICDPKRSGVPAVFSTQQANKKPSASIGPARHPPTSSGGMLGEKRRKNEAARP